MAAHGHLDVLHVSLWLRGVAMVIDPGTGAYHADKQLRNWLASRAKLTTARVPSDKEAEPPPARAVSVGRQHLKPRQAWVLCR